jgi:CRP-like cAMP-binding protein
MRLHLTRCCVDAPTMSITMLRRADKMFAVRQFYLQKPVATVLDTRRAGDEGGFRRFCRVSDLRAEKMPENHILLSLPAEEHRRVIACSVAVTLPQHSVIYGPGTRIENVYFPESGMISLLTAGRDNRAIETAVVGREGLVGSKVVLGAPRTNGQAIVQLSGQALQTPTQQFLRCYRELPTLCDLVNRQVGLLLFQAEQNALCHALHTIEARFCRWVLQASDRLDSNILELTQEACSQNLGVQRTSISMVAHALQLAGCIRTRRGKIEILDRASLRNAACECYDQVRQRFEANYSKAA